jgi:hypothetical protein
MRTPTDTPLLITRISVPFDIHSGSVQDLGDHWSEATKVLQTIILNQTLTAVALLQTQSACLKPSVGKRPLSSRLGFFPRQSSLPIRLDLFAQLSCLMEVM